MKNTRLSKVMAIAITLAVLLSLFTFAAPVSAGTLAWSAVATPSLATNQLVAAAQDVNAVAISPNFATDKTMFAGSVNATSGFLSVFHSTNGGYSWTEMANPPPVTVGLAGTAIVAIKVSPTYSSDKTVFVATDTTVYRSTDGGVNFSQLGVVTLAGTEVITSMDVAPNYNGIGVIAVGIADPTAGLFADPTGLTGTSVQMWGVLSALTWTAVGPLTSTAGIDISSVKFSPNYPVDATLLVISTDTGAGAPDMLTPEPYLRARVGTIWDTTLAPVAVGATTVTDYATPPGAGTDLVMSSIALPSDYRASIPTTRRAYVAIVGAAGVSATDSNVYRVTNVTAGVALNPGVELGDIAYSGTFGAGTLLGGWYDPVGATTGAQVYRTANPADAPASVLWYGADNAPTGDMAAATTVKLAIASDFATSKLVVAGTTGADSAFAQSTDGVGNIWNETGLVDNGGADLTLIGNIALSPKFATDNTAYIVTDDLSAGAFNTSVWRTMDGGTTWARLFVGAFTTAGIGVLTLSPNFATDSSIWVGDTGGTVIQYSADKGNSWAPLTSAVAIADMAATDANTIYVADNASGNVVKSITNAWTWNAPVATGSTGVLTSIVAKGAIVVVGDSVGAVFGGDDAGVTFAQIGTVQVIANMYVDFEGEFIYAVDGAAGNTYMFEFGVSPDWNLLTSATNPAAAGPGAPAVGFVPDIMVSIDKTLYVLDPDAIVNETVYRTITPEQDTNVTFQWMTGLAAAGANSIAVVPAATGNLIATSQTIGIVAKLFMFTDNLSAGSAAPTVISPANNFDMVVPNSITFSIDNAANAKVTAWDVQISTDPNFINNTSAVGAIQQVPPATQVTVTVSAVIAPTNATIYWRARAAAPLISPWTTPRTVNSQLTIPPNYPALVQPVGATALDVSVNPVFNWNAYLFATGYELQIAKDASFSDASLVANLTGVNALGNVNSYYLATPTLDNSTAYFWRVRAVTTTGPGSDWSPSVGFVTAAAPTPPATQPPITIPPQPTPTITVTIPPITLPTQPATGVTPGWIYAIIAIGAILIIAIIILIVRTRRPS